MANKIFTRIQLKYDSWDNWKSVKDTFVPLTGEVCVVNPGEDSTSCLLKVGDGSTTFNALPWVSALAADVYAWAKAADVRLKDQKLEFFIGDNVIKTVDLSSFATEAEVNALLASIAKSGSIYDIKEGSTVNNGTDKDTHPKYLIFNCGSSTTVI